MPLLIPNDTMVSVFPNLLISATEVSETCSSTDSPRSHLLFVIPATAQYFFVPVQWFVLHTAKLET